MSSAPPITTMTVPEAPVTAQAAVGRACSTRRAPVATAV